MRIGVVGLGKLGLPVAIAMASKGHSVYGWDIDEDAAMRNLDEVGPNGESFEGWRSSVEGFTVVRDIKELCDKNVDIIFVAVQTPNTEEFQGDTRLPRDRQDFDYTFLRDATDMINEELDYDCVIAIISTVLPGAVRDHVLPRCHGVMHVVYNPFFIAMGTVVPDFFHPEFVLVGVHDTEAARILIEFYKTITDAVVYETSVENAELIKVAYNTFIGMKIAFANTMLELCDSLPGTNCDAVTSALGLATDRLISTRYMRGGMGDGGCCHPRDQIALSWLARKHRLSYDPFASIMRGREAQAEWLCRELVKRSKDLRLAILGLAFKKDSAITTGSAALLCLRILHEWGHKVAVYDPKILTSRGDRLDRDRGRTGPPTVAYAFLVGCDHTEFREYRFPLGSVVVDPWGIIEDQEGVTVHRLGRMPNER